jgi:hypothetical protein
MNALKENFKKKHNGDLSTLLKIYWENKPIYKSQYFWIAFICSMISIVLPNFITISKILIIDFLANKSLSVFPNILGFSLGGYILLISLNSREILDVLTEPADERKDKYSFYQKASAVFAFSILLQTLSLIIGLVFVLVIEVGNSSFVSYKIAEILNSIALFILVFVMSYAILLIVQIILNVFNFGQVLHFFIRIDNLEKENNN